MDWVTVSSLFFKSYSLAFTTTLSPFSIFLKEHRCFNLPLTTFHISGKTSDSLSSSDRHGNSAKPLVPTKRVLTPPRDSQQALCPLPPGDLHIEHAVGGRQNEPRAEDRSATVEQRAFDEQLQVHHPRPLALDSVGSPLDLQG